MWKLGLVAALLAGCAVEDFGSEEQDVINGAVVTTATYKSIAMITYQDNQDREQWFCTGVLVDPSYILTQAQCFDWAGLSTSDADRVNVYLGVDELSNRSGSSWYAVTDAWRETSNGVGHDLAILKLDKPVTDHAPSPIARTRPADGTMTTLVGYGSPDLNVNNQDALRKGNGPTVSCTSNGVSASNVLCVSAAAAGACNGGDTGGPLFDAAGNVVGVFNDFTKSQCNQGYDIYSSTADELAFIDAHVPVATTTVPPPTTTTPPPSDTPDPSAPPTAPAPTIGGCSAGGGQGGLLLIGLAFIARRARSKRS